MRSPESTDGPLAHSTPLGKPAENLVDSAKADETDSEAGFQLDKADRKKARRRRNHIEKRPLSQLDGLPKDKSGPAENPADLAKAEEVGLEAGLQLDGEPGKRWRDVGDSMGSTLPRNLTDCPLPK